ncbi:MAG: TIGR02452 family protein, partial [Lachnospiraceae bacterium]|nr:TIGR02452 family protein [Lachnospiraceae bacterium]
AERRALHEIRANRILDLAKANGNETIVLGAFGCGAFQNPPEVVAAGICKAVQQHRRDFRTIEFAVFCGSRDSANYEAFRRVFESV